MSQMTCCRGGTESKHSIQRGSPVVCATSEKVGTKLINSRGVVGTARVMESCGKSVRVNRFEAFERLEKPGLRRGHTELKRVLYRGSVSRGAGDGCKGPKE